MSIFQFVNVLYFTFQAIYMTVPMMWIIFVIVFWEGLLGGCCYVRYDFHFAICDFALIFIYFFLRQISGKYIQSNLTRIANAI